MTSRDRGRPGGHRVPQRQRHGQERQPTPGVAQLPPDLGQVGPAHLTVAALPALPALPACATLSAMGVHLATARVGVAVLPPAPH